MRSSLVIVFLTLISMCTLHEVQEIERHVGFNVSNNYTSLFIFYSL